MKQKESVMKKCKRSDRAFQIEKQLSQIIPDAKMQLTYSNNWELLVAVQLSAQCTDKKVNEVTPALFHAYPHLSDYANAKQSELEKYIFSTGFYHNKAKNIISAAKVIQNNFQGEIPRTMDEMLSIPGVARKTANVVLGNAYGAVFGIAVDTHVKRLARIFGLTDETNPIKIEKDLMEVFPQEKWFHITYLFIEYGRRFCPARKHDHSSCPLNKFVV